MKFHRMLLRIALWLLLTLCATVWAQDTASITGTVTDASGAAVPNVQLTLTNAEHGNNRTTSSNGSGDFLFASLPIGSYDLTVAAEGFKKYEARGIVLVIAYCLGLGIPFVLLAFGSASAVAGLDWLRRHTRALQIFGGVLLVAVGVALVSGGWNDFVSWLRDAFVSDVRLPI